MTIIGSYASHNPDEAALAYDGNPATRWTTGTPMVSGMVYQIELDKPYLISGLHLTSPVPTDDPVKWVVAVEMSSGGHGRVEVASGEGAVNRTWEPVAGMFVRIEQWGTSEQFWWSISGIEVTTAPVPPYVEPPPVVPPVVPPDWDNDPANWTEARCRAWAERWAMQFPGWGLYHDERRTLSGAVVKVTAHVTFPLVRTRVEEDGTVITEEWPWMRQVDNPLP